MTGTNWNAHRFFGLRQGKISAAEVGTDRRKSRNGTAVCSANGASAEDAPKDQTIRRSLRCAVYTRVSTEHGLEQEFNSLDNQREASEAYIKSQADEGWKLIRNRYDDGGYSGGSIEGQRSRSSLMMFAVAGSTS